MESTYIYPNFDGMGDPSQMFDKDVETLLRDKIAYHRAQARMHVKLANETKDKLQMLTGEKAPKEQYVKTLFGENGANGAAPLPLDMNFSVTVWKPRVEKILRAMGHSMRTEDILREVDNRYLQHDTIRKQGIGAISSSLFALVEKGLVQKIPSESRGYMYKWI